MSLVEVLSSLIARDGQTTNEAHWQITSFQLSLFSFSSRIRNSQHTSIAGVPGAKTARNSFLFSFSSTDELLRGCRRNHSCHKTERGCDLRFESSHTFSTTSHGSGPISSRKCHAATSAKHAQTISSPGASAWMQTTTQPGTHDTEQTTMRRWAVGFEKKKKKKKSVDASHASTQKGTRSKREKAKVPFKNGAASHICGARRTRQRSRAQTTAGTQAARLSTQKPTRALGKQRRKRWDRQQSGCAEMTARAT